MRQPPSQFSSTRSRRRPLSDRRCWRHRSPLRRRGCRSTSCRAHGCPRCVLRHRSPAGGTRGWPHVRARGRAPRGTARRSCRGRRHARHGLRCRRLSRLRQPREGTHRRQATRGGPRRSRREQLSGERPRGAQLASRLATAATSRHFRVVGIQVSTAPLRLATSAGTRCGESARLGADASSPS